MQREQEVPVADPEGSAADVLALAEEGVVLQRRGEAQVLVAATAWADQHPVVEERPGMRSNRHPCQVGGEGTPWVAEFAHAELAVSLRIHPLACRRLVADALDLRHRLPGLWRETVEDLAVPVWVARKIAARTRQLPAAEAALIDADVAPVARSMPPSRLLERVDALVILADERAAEQERRQGLADRFVRFNRSDQRGLKGLYAKLDAGDAVVGEARVQRLAEVLRSRAREALAAAERPSAELESMDVFRSRALGMLIRDPEAAAAVLSGGDGAGPSKSAATVVVHVHLSEAALRPSASGVARVEGEGPFTLAQLRELLGHSRVSVRPVLDPRECAPVDSYEFAGDLREAVFTMSPADCYPYAVNTTHRRDVDHTEPYRADGPPGQTRVENAGPMTRHHHRIKTHGSLSVRQPGPGRYVWRTPNHRYRLVDPAGTHDLDPRLGRDLFSDDPLDRALAGLMIEHGIRL